WLDVRGHDADALFGQAVRGGRGGKRRLADKGVAVILSDRAAAAGVTPFTPHDMRRTYISELLDAGADLATVQKNGRPCKRDDSWLQPSRGCGQAQSRRSRPCAVLPAAGLRKRLQKR